MKRLLGCALFALLVLMIYGGSGSILATVVHVVLALLVAPIGVAFGALLFWCFDD